MESRLIFDQTTCHHRLAMLTRKINHHISLRTQPWFEVDTILCVLKSKFIVLKHLDFTSPSLFNITVAINPIVLTSFILLFQIISVAYTSDQALFWNCIILLWLLSFLLIPYVKIYGKVGLFFPFRFVRPDWIGQIFLIDICMYFKMISQIYWVVSNCQALG